MADITPANISLPEFLDPLLSYISENLPSPLYSLLISLFSHLLALLSALYNLFNALLSTNLLTWDAQTIIPPLVALLSAYLALLSLYRTTTWMFRASFWFLKWGAILGGLVFGVDWWMGNGGNAVGSWGVANVISGLVLDAVNGQGRNAAGGPRSHTPKRNRPVQSMKRPRAWDSFGAHRKYQEQLAKDEQELQNVIQNIISAAGATISRGWWGFANDVAQGDEDTKRTAKSTKGSISR